jgi:hypothetical protein
MADERIEAIQIALGGLAAGDSPAALKSKIDDLYRAGNVNLGLEAERIGVTPTPIGLASR